MPKDFVAVQNLEESFENFYLGKILFFDEFLFDFLLKSAFVAVFHKNIEVMLTGDFFGQDSDQIRMLAESFNNIDFPLNCGFLLLSVVMWDYFYGQKLLFTALLVGLIDGAKISLSNLLIKQNCKVLIFFVNKVACDEFPYRLCLFLHDQKVKRYNN